MDDITSTSAGHGLGHEPRHVDMDAIKGSVKDFGPSQVVFDVFDWHPAYLSCQRFFLKHAQYDDSVQAVCALINICLPFQFEDPILSAAHASRPPDGRLSAGQFGLNASPRPTQPSKWVSLVPFIRRLIITGFDTEPVLQGFFGDDWNKGIGPVQECERRNYLFEAKSGGWAQVKRHYDMNTRETVPFLQPLKQVTEAEIDNAEKLWSQWLAMEDWMVGPRAPSGPGAMADYSRENGTAGVRNAQAKGRSRRGVYQPRGATRGRPAARIRPCACLTRQDRQDETTASGTFALLNSGIEHCTEYAAGQMLAMRVASSAVFWSLASALPQISLPIAQQIPPVAVAGQQYSFQFAPSTFTSSEGTLSYSLADGPAWLSVADDRTLSGTPSTADIGYTSVQLQADDGTGQASLNVTLVVVARPQVSRPASITAQLQDSGTIANNDTLIIGNSKQFSIPFATWTFFGPIGMTYRAISADRTPLPSWLNFNPNVLNFSGLSPPLTTVSQTFGVLLLASTIDGFAEASAEFSILVSTHVLGFTPYEKTVPYRDGTVDLSGAFSRGLSLDGKNVGAADLASVTAAAPAGTTFVAQNQSVVGPPSAFRSAPDFVITATDRFGGTAQALVHVNITSLFEQQLPPLNLTAGEPFTYTLPSDLVAAGTQLSFDFGSASWLLYSGDNMTISGMVPDNVSASSIDASVVASRGTESEMQTFELVVQSASATQSSTRSFSLSTRVSATSSSPTGSRTSTATPLPSNASSGLSKGAIAGIVIGSVLGLLLLLLLIFCCLKRRKEMAPKIVKRDSTATNDSGYMSNYGPRDNLYPRYSIRRVSTPPQIAQIQPLDPLDERRASQLRMNAFYAVPTITETPPAGPIHQPAASKPAIPAFGLFPKPYQPPAPFSRDYSQSNDLASSPPTSEDSALDDEEESLPEDSVLGELDRNTLPDSPQFPDLDVVGRKRNSYIRSRASSRRRSNPLFGGSVKGVSPQPSKVWTSSSPHGSAGRSPWYQDTDPVPPVPHRSPERPLSVASSAQIGRAVTSADMETYFAPSPREEDVTAGEQMLERISNYDYHVSPLHVTKHRFGHTQHNSRDAGAFSTDNLWVSQEHKPSYATQRDVSGMESDLENSGLYSKAFI